MLINEDKVVPRLKSRDDHGESNIWYLDSGASNHMTGQHSKFKELNAEVTRKKVWGWINREY